MLKLPDPQHSCGKAIQEPKSKNYENDKHSAARRLVSKALDRAETTSIYTTIYMATSNKKSPI